MSGGTPPTGADECAAGDEAEAEPEAVQAADPASPSPPRRAHCTFILPSTVWRWCESAFALLSHQKVTKRLTDLFFYGIITVVKTT